MCTICPSFRRWTRSGWRRSSTSSTAMATAASTSTTFRRPCGSLACRTSTRRTSLITHNYHHANCIAITKMLNPMLHTNIIAIIIIVSSSNPVSRGRKFENLNQQTHRNIRCSFRGS
uniref:(northern house mosquito) hypothetical protein n=1 Tax=Culex pipiens TaxID=7175 RepID=A0A8D8HRC9_CULPI